MLSGILACLDGYMNIALEQTEEYVNGQVRKYSAADSTFSMRVIVEEQVRRCFYPWKQW